MINFHFLTHFTNFILRFKVSRDVSQNLLVGLVIFGITITGCNLVPVESSIEKTIRSSEQSYNMTQQKTEDGQDTLLTITPRIAVLTLSSSPTPQMTPTYTPISELTSKQQMEIMDFINETPDCKLPCWNGLTPGISKASDIQAFFARLGYELILNPSFLEAEGQCSGILKKFPQGTFSDVSSESSIMIDVFWHNYIVNDVRISGWDHPEQFDLKRIAEILGTPDHIYAQEEEGDRYTIHLHYLSKKIIIQIVGYRTLINTDNNLPFQICMKTPEKKYISARLYSDSFFPKIQEEYLQFPYEEYSTLLGITKDELWEKLQQPDTCLSYP